ncbi:hypothetical protein N7448_008020 [Penicillium atrosanguineum]|uniref:uncharacterized protein n=1 Tax=Penicillium atrosanguineum TaxID=1132637 RepID=UPI0023A2A74C|nr:uncharacterized protein N7443_000961 [Penicillium atrosanguineum]KAJ5127241.1 hypothetical protein N7448_008020 [Penicillium atrosanguineum]KAJ5147448.1 hypothetical protein N7526_000800 [Penicillium atrosanguineum]KAJ5314077.1 hypothetical protein N7443_000961 [Penicillium atrosanguineum]
MGFAACILLLLAVAIAPASLASPTHTASPVVDLGYARYQGSHNSTYDIDVFRGIRYAAPPVGNLRWQAPQEPRWNRTAIFSAVDQPPICPQSGGAKLPKAYHFNSALGDEDCLFLNVYTPPGAKDLPVLLWIHGGGYGLNGATYDPSEWMKTNNNGFISVMIQYRLGAFGFLASEDVHRHGVLNAGLLDMRFALRWTQRHISKFGGDPSRVTVGGESSGAGAAMLQAMAYGGREDGLFNNARLPFNDLIYNCIIAASPYTPTQYHYNDTVPTNNYYDFAARAGCYHERHTPDSSFECLVRSDTDTLQYASGNISTSGAWGTFAFLPVTDGDFIRELPSKQLLQRKISGKRILSGNNANDGVPLSPPTITTDSEFWRYVKSTFPLFTNSDYLGLLAAYRSWSSPKGSIPLYDTLGDRGPTALNQSEFANGLQQTVFDIFAETTFDCPSYWLADAFSGAHGKESWKYQYSVTPAFHGADLSAYFSVGKKLPTSGFRHAFQKILGSFIIKNTPIISIHDAKGGASNATLPCGTNGNISWPRWHESSPVLMNLNTTGGTLVRDTVTDHLAYWLREDPGVTNDFRLADAATWEGGRRRRCDFWRSVSPRVPY